MAKFSLVVLRKDKIEDFIVFEDDINTQCLEDYLMKMALSGRL